MIHECTECGELGATLRRDDAADEEHWFHPAYWHAFNRWLLCLPKTTAGEGEK